MKTEAFGKTIAENPGKVIIAVVLITILFGSYASQMSMTSDFHSFMPDDEISRAYTEIQDNYGGVEMVQIVAKDDNVLTKEALLEQLRLKKEILTNSQIAEALQTPNNPENSVFSVADMVVMMDVGGKAYAGFMRGIINSTEAMESLNSSIFAVNRSVSDYLLLYGSNASQENITAALNLTYQILHSFHLQAGNMGPDIASPVFSMDMSADEKIAHLENMSQEEIDNVIRYGTPLDPADFMNLRMEFQKSLESFPALSSRLSALTLSLSQKISECLATEPVYSNLTMNATFTDAYADFFSMSQKFSDMVSNLEVMMSSMDPSAMSMAKEQMEMMISDDFDPETPKASASLMLVNLNGTQRAGESDEEFSDRMVGLHLKIKDIVGSFPRNSEYLVMSLRLMDEDMKETMGETSKVLLPVVFILVILILLVIFRSVLDTVLGLIGLFMAIVWTYGFGVMASMTFNQISTTVAVLIVGLGIDYAIHTIMRYREEIRAGKDVKKSIVSMEAHLGMALILATVTTIVSFLSNISSPIPPLRDFGIMNAFGILSAFVINLTFIPSAKVIIDGRRERKGMKVIKERGKRTESGVLILNRILAVGAVGAEHHPYRVLGIVAVISLASLYGATHLDTNFSETDFLPENSPSAETMTYIMEHFQSSAMEESYILIKGDLTSPELLRAIEETRAEMRDDRYVSISESQDITTVIRDLSEKNVSFRAMVASADVDGDGLPDSDIPAIYEWLFEHDERTKYVLYRENGTYESALIRIKSTSDSNSEHAVLISELGEDVKPLENAGYETVVTGGSILIYSITTSLQNSQWNSLMITLAISLIILTLVFYYLKKGIAIGFLTTLPVAIALLWSMGMMYIVGLGFNMMTVTITALTIGLGITYSIHLTHRFLEELDRSSPEEAVRTAVRHTGSAIFGAAATTMGGFGVLMLSSMPPLRQFGEISTISILFSFLLSVFILPTFLVMWAKRRK